MKWTTEKPTKPGWYWQRLKGRLNPALFHISQIREYCCELVDAFTMESPGDGWEWSSEPIPEPEE